jgi:hypothetical protein
LEVSRELIVDGLKDCVMHRWICKQTETSVAAVRQLIDANGAILPVPFEGKPGRGTFDFSPAGAEVYRMLSAEILGADWENGLFVEVPHYWEAHHYCATENGLKGILERHQPGGHVPRLVRTVEIGRWCVDWWKVFAAGFRFEITFGEP